MNKALQNPALRILLIADGFIRVAGAMLAPIYALFVEEVGGSVLDAGITGAAFAIAAGFTVLLSGKISDSSKDPRRIVAVGYTIIAFSFFAMIFVDSVIGLILVQFLMGFGEAIYVPSYDALYSVHLDKHEEAQEWSMWEAMSYFTTAFGSLVGGAIVYFFGFDVLFVAMGIMSIGSALYLNQLPKHSL